jgi:hypothetical protein
MVYYYDVNQYFVSKVDILIGRIGEAGKTVFLWPS